MKIAEKGKLLKKISAMGVLKALEELRLHRITLSICSVEPFDPQKNYCEPFNHDEKYHAQVWDEEDQMYQDAFYGKTVKEAFWKAVKDLLG